MKKLDVDSYEIIGLKSHYVLVKKGKEVKKATLNGKTYDVKFHKSLTLDTSIQNRIGLDDQEAISSIENSGSYGVAMKISIDIV